MNLNLVAVALNPKARSGLERRAQHCLAYLEDAGLILDEKRALLTEHFYALNQNYAPGWNVPLIHEDDHKRFYSFSAPPIPVTRTINVENFWPTVTKGLHGETDIEFLSNWFGFCIDRDTETLTAWTDRHGIGRAYVLHNDDFFAMSNHIGALCHFATASLTLDTEAIALYAGSGFYMGASTPLKDIYRLKPGTQVGYRPGYNVTFRKYKTQQDLFERRDPANPNYDEVAEQFQYGARNIGTLAKRTPTIGLSGGRDSRLMAAVWLSSAREAKINTIHKTDGEVTVASELMERFKRANPDYNVDYKITKPSATSVSQGLADRISACFTLWDGDAPHNRMVQNVTFAQLNRGVALSGALGEIMHGIYYLKPGQIENWLSPEESMPQRLRSILGTNLLSSFGKETAAKYTEHAVEQSSRAGWQTVVALDQFFLEEKGRRWWPQALYATSPLLYSAPAFARACFDMNPQDKVNNVMIREVVKRTVPEWDGVPTFKATGDELRQEVRNRINTFDTDPATFWSLFNQGHHWKQYFNEDRIANFVNLVRSEESLPYHGATLNKVVWVEETHRHFDKLNDRLRRLNLVT